MIYLFFFFAQTKEKEHIRLDTVKNILRKIKNKKIRSHLDLISLAKRKHIFC